MSAPLELSRGRPRRERRERLPSHRDQRGLSLIELVLFIIIVGVGVAGILLVFNVTTKASADPLIQKQMLAIAEALIEEVQAKPFTYCDPDDAQATTATSATVGASGCQVTVEALGPEAVNQPPTGPLETRTGAVRPFDNVNDYGASLTINPITDVTGTTIGGLGAYSATIAVAGSALDVIAAADSLLITVTVTGPGSKSLVLQGYRTRYAPNAVP